MSTRSSARNLFPPLDNPELIIQRRSRVDPTLLYDFEMATDGNSDPPVLDLRTMEELCQPTLNGRGGPIALISIQATDFRLKNDMIQQHVTQSNKVNGVTDDALRLYLFPHSLTHHATAWFDRLPWNSITTFEQMAKIFLGKYFPPTMVTKLRNEITNFRQRPDESLFEAWERYKLSIDRCPNHNMLPLRNEIINFRQRPDESLFEAWERYKLSIDRCPNHNMLPVTQIDTFYNGLTLRHRDTINVAAATVGQTQNVYAARAYNQGSNSYQPQVVTTTDFTNYMKANDAILKNIQTNMTSLKNSNLELKKMLGQFMKMNTALSLGSRTLRGNTITNPKEDLKGITTRSENAYQGPMIPTTSSLPQVVECETEVTKNTMPPTNNGSTKDVQPLVVQIETPIPNSEPVVAPASEPVEAHVSALKPNHKPSIPYPSRLHDQKLSDKAKDQKEKFFKIFQDLIFNISFADALILMPKLTLRHRDTINVAASGTFMKRRPEECYDLIENMTAYHNDCDTSIQRSELSSSITSSSDSKIIALKAEVAEINKNLMKVLQINQKVKAVSHNCETCGGPHSYNDCPATVGQTQKLYVAGAYNQGGNSYQRQSNRNLLRNQGNNHRIPQGNNQGRNQFFQGANHGQSPPPAYQAPAYLALAYQAPVHQAPIPQPQVVTTTEFTNYMKENDAIMKNMQTNMTSLTNSNLYLKNMFGQFMKMNTASSLGLRTLPSNTITNPKEELKGITTRSVIAYKGPTIPTTSSPPKVVECETEMTKDTPVVTLVLEPVVAPVSALKPNPKPSIPYTSRLYDLKLRDKSNDQKNKFFQIFQDLDFNISFMDALILMPMFVRTIKRMDECLALANLGASINLMPLSVWNKISLPEMSPTCMTLELADCLISRPVGVAEDVFLKVGTFHFPTDFVVVDFDVDPRVSLILRRSFLKTRRSLIDVYEGELTIRVGKEVVTFNLYQTSRYSANYDATSVNRIDLINVACEEYSQEVLGFSVSGNSNPSTEPIVSTSSPTLTPFGESDFLLEEIDALLAIDDEPISPKIDDS
uniref:Retrotransposon gag domain-containing protein n=1 Tax=Tanacetum cinerariifolium TaxID=118510 RepID=A0A6L2P2G1_TANCI|nr:hypothetical protein [Tanacetum cinerariifolium]